MLSECGNAISERQISKIAWGAPIPPKRLPHGKFETGVISTYSLTGAPETLAAQLMKRTGYLDEFRTFDVDINIKIMSKYFQDAALLPKLEERDFIAFEAK